MSTYCVFGMSVSAAKKIARKALDKEMASFHRKNKRPMTEAESELWVAAEVARLMRDGKPKKLSEMFDAPQFAQQFVDLCRRHDGGRDLVVKSRAKIRDGFGGYKRNPKTGKPILEWQISA